MSDIPFAPDAIRLFVYKWILSNIKRPPPLVICDVGSGKSGFSAYLSSLGNIVYSIEKNLEYVLELQKRKEEFKTEHVIHSGDFLEVTKPNNFDIIISSFAIQHNPDDIAKLCYTHCAEVAKEKNSQIFIAHAYNHNERWVDNKRGGKEGDLYWYNFEAVHNNIISPITKKLNQRDLMYTYTLDYMRWNPSDNNWWDLKDPFWCDPETATTILMEFKISA